MTVVTNEVIREEMETAVEALEGVVRCYCGAKYWETKGDGIYCVSCGENAVEIPEAWAVVLEATKRAVARLVKAVK